MYVIIRALARHLATLLGLLYTLVLGPGWSLKPAIEYQGNRNRPARVDKEDFNDYSLYKPTGEH
jgi:hypothetical protein